MAKTKRELAAGEHEGNGPSVDPFPAIVVIFPLESTETRPLFDVS